MGNSIKIPRDKDGKLELELTRKIVADLIDHKPIGRSITINSQSEEELNELLNVLKVGSRLKNYEFTMDQAIDLTTGNYSYSLTMRRTKYA